MIVLAIDEQRNRLLEAIRYADLIIPEENRLQRRSNMHAYHVDAFVMSEE